ncbi:MAG: peptidylprolyl isomerase [Clostridia bacterium]|nr:peptidylprolyl isomerase [Clostridia bacterium]
MRKAFFAILSLLVCVTAVSFAACSGEKDKTNSKSNEVSTMSNEEKVLGDIVHAEIEMENGGIIKLELYHNVAPITVENFVNLAESGFYDGLIFHRVISGFMIQGGDPKGDGTGGPGYTIKGEFTANGVNNTIKHERGVISMARQGHPYYDDQYYDTAGSQFFIMHKDYPSLNGKYAAFGKVTEGMEVVDAIAAVQTDANDKPLKEQKIKKITITY